MHYGQGVKDIYFGDVAIDFETIQSSTQFDHVKLIKLQTILIDLAAKKITVAYVNKKQMPCRHLHR